MLFECAAANTVRVIPDFRRPVDSKCYLVKLFSGSTALCLDCLVIREKVIKDDLSGDTSVK